MATPIIMPRQGQTVESCIIAKWHKKKGDKVQPGDILFTYETDKATFEEEAQEEGLLLDVFFEEGDDVPVLETVCVIGTEGEDISQYSPNNQDRVEDQQDDTQEKLEPVSSPIEQEIPKETHFPEGDGKIKISPRARNLAEKVGVDYQYAEATGPEGRIIERDIRQLIDKGSMATRAATGEYMGLQPGTALAGTGLGGRITTEDLQPTPVAVVEPTIPLKEQSMPIYEDVKISNIRKVIAKSMHHSLSTTAQLTLNASFDATDILEFRKKLKAYGSKSGLEKITINDIILYAVSRTLLNHKDLNAHFLDDTMRIFNTVNLGVAIDTGRGLMVPTIFNANQKSLDEISSEVKELAGNAQKGTINPDLLTNGTFTVTNLGSLGIESFTPVLNPPQTGILGVNNIVKRARDNDGSIEYYPAMGLSLTFDHRGVDGAPAARFLKELVENLESFSILLCK